MKSDELFEGIEILEVYPFQGLCTSEEVIEIIRDYFKGNPAESGFVVFTLTKEGNFLSVEMLPGMYDPVQVVKNATLAGGYGVLTLINRMGKSHFPTQEDQGRIKKIRDLCRTSGTVLFDEIYLDGEKGYSSRYGKEIGSDPV